MGKWLDKDGLIDLKTRIKTKVDTKVDKYTEESAGKFLQTDNNGNAVWGTAASPSAVAEATEQWLEDNVSGGSTIAVDASLTVEGAAADAKSTGALVKSAATQPTDSTNRLWINESSETEYQVPTYGEFSDLKSASDADALVGNLATYGTLNKGKKLNANNGSLTADPTQNTTDFIPVSGGELIYVNGGNRYFFYASDKSTTKGTGNISTATSYIHVNNDRGIIVPDNGAEYFRITYYVTEEDFYVQKEGEYDKYLQNIIANNNDGLMMKRTTLTSSDDLNNIKQIGIYNWHLSSTPSNLPSDFSGGATMIVFAFNPVDTSGFKTQMITGSDTIYYRIQATYAWQSWIKICKDSETVAKKTRLTSSDNLNNVLLSGVYSWSTLTGVPTNSPISGGSTMIVFSFNGEDYGFKTQLVTAEDTLYYRLQKSNGSWNDWIKMAKFSDIGNASSTRITHIVPENNGQLNVVRRCRQFTDIKWTPLFDIPRLCLMGSGEQDYNSDNPLFEDVFKAGVEYTGLPYARAMHNASNWGYGTSGMKLGFVADFSTFISCIRNPDSVVAKESVFGKSAHNACFYATVCSSMVSYAYGLYRYYSTSELASLSSFTTIGKVSTLQANAFKLGDFLSSTTLNHSAIISDIIQDGSGNALYIEVSEATDYGNDNWDYKGNSIGGGGQYGGVCRRKAWAIADFMEYWGEFNLRRYSNIESVTYTPSQYVNTGNELDLVATINFPCMPYMGENFAYKQNNIYNTKVLTASGFSYMRVKKDGTAWNANGTTDYYVVSGDSVDVGFSTTGDYEAYLCNVSNGEETVKTVSCHWKVID